MQVEGDIKALGEKINKLCGIKVMLVDLLTSQYQGVPLRSLTLA